MWLLVLVGLSWGNGLQWPVDLDGDGKEETAVFPEANEENELADDLYVKVGKAKVPFNFNFPASIVPLDLKHGDSKVEVMVCEVGPRDDSDCSLFRYKKGTLEPITPPAEVEVSHYTASGSGIVLAHSD